MTRTDELAVGMRLRQPVYDGRQLMLPAGKQLNGADVDFLRQRCPGQSVSVEDPVLDELIGFADDSESQTTARTTQQQLAELVSGVQNNYASRMTCKTFDCRGVHEAVDGVLKFISNNPVVSNSLIKPRDPDDYLATHAAHVFYLSLIMGNSVRDRVLQARKHSPLRYSSFDPKDLNLTPLALAAFFMDLGMVPIRDIFKQVDPLTTEQCEKIRNHPVASAEALPHDAPELAKLIIETHHENYDGSGYPYGLKGDEIHIFSRVLRVADAYAAATSSQVYKEACSPVRALWEMTWGPFAQFYDPILLKVFSTVIQPYPIGAKVGLNNGQYAVVVKYGQASPFLPDVVIAFDENGERLAKNRLIGPIKLSEHPSLRIASFAGEDLTDLYEQNTMIEKITAAEFTTLYQSMYTGCAAKSGVAAKA